MCAALADGVGVVAEPDVPDVAGTAVGAAVGAAVDDDAGADTGRDLHEAQGARVGVPGGVLPEGSGVGVVGGQHRNRRSQRRLQWSAIG